MIAVVTTGRTSLDASLVDKQVWLVTYRGHPNPTLSNDLSLEGRTSKKQRHGKVKVKVIET